LRLERTELAEFKKDLKKLRRQFPTLEEDLEILINYALPAFHTLQMDIGIVEISDMGGRGELRLPVFKVRRIACKSIPSKDTRTGLRLVYAFDEAEQRVELIEIYNKVDQASESRDRIEKYYGKKSVKKGK
jgi:hypothetical protein